jgi:hypothetical protein
VFVDVIRFFVLRGAPIVFSWKEARFLVIVIMHFCIISPSFIACMELGTLVVLRVADCVGLVTSPERPEDKELVITGTMDLIIDLRLEVKAMYRVKATVEFLVTRNWDVSANVDGDFLVQYGKSNFVE